MRFGTLPLPSTTYFNLVPQADLHGRWQTVSQLNIMGLQNYEFQLHGIDMNDVDTNITTTISFILIGQLNQLTHHLKIVVREIIVLHDNLILY